MVSVCGPAIERAQVLADRAAVVEAHAGVDRERSPTVRASLTKPDAVTNTPPVSEVRSTLTETGGPRYR